MAALRTRGRRAPARHRPRRLTHHGPRPPAGPKLGPNGVIWFSKKTYDTLGRTLTIPAVDTPTGAGAITLGYYDTDAIQAISQNGTTESYTLDPAGRRLTSTTTDSGGTTTKTIVRHYTGDGDNPASVDTTTGGATHTTRYTDSLSGDLGASINDDGSIQLSLADPHGDTATTITLPNAGATATGIDAWQDYDEYGNSLAAGPSDPLGYGWLGAKQRSTDTATTGLTLMGARLYDSQTGRFLSMDPIPGGSANAYDYANADPVNSSDVSGLCPLCVWGAVELCEAFCVEGAEAVGALWAATQDSGTKQYRSFTRRNARYNLAVRTGRNPRTFDAHHIFPVKYESDFKQIFKGTGVNIPNPKYLMWWNRSPHRRAAYAYNQNWKEFLSVKSNRTAARVLQHGRNIMRGYGFKVSF